VLIPTSFLPPRHIRRLALVVFAVSFVLVAASLWGGIGRLRRTFLALKNAAAVRRLWAKPAG
jgi:hypothetical protein